MNASVDVVIPTIGRESLVLLLASLDGPPQHLPERVILVDDRRAPREPLVVGTPSPELRARLHVVPAGGRGPAAARNVGWRSSKAQWVAFLDDDVLPCRGWNTELARDLADLPTDVVASQGRVRVPLPAHRAPTDRERSVQTLETARWISANIAYRTSALRRLGGFDERFPRQYREDTDLALRARRAGLRVARGRRTVVHPIWPTTPWASVRAQAANADDALMRALHGRDWRAAADAPSSAFAQHVAITASAMFALGALALGAPLVAAAGLLAWLGGTAAFAWQRIAPGPRTPGEVATMVATSAAIPPAAVWHRLAGELRARVLQRRAAIEAAAFAPFARDGMVARDVQGDRHPRTVRPRAGAREAQRRRAAGIHISVVASQVATDDAPARAEDARR